VPTPVPPNQEQASNDRQVHPQTTSTNRQSSAKPEHSLKGTRPNQFCRKHHVRGANSGAAGEGRPTAATGPWGDTAHGVVRQAP